MPELPEVETIVRQLRDRIVGKTITKVVVQKEKMFIGDPSRIVGSTILSVSRRAKMIVLTLSSGYVLSVHLKMTGQVLVGRVDDTDTATFPREIPFAGITLPATTTHIILTLHDQMRIFFNDNRQFGWMKVMELMEWEKVSQLVGPEPLESSFTPQILAALLAPSRRPIKVVLMDPSKIAGIGNIYANEALWHAGIYPGVPALECVKSMPERIPFLYESIKSVLELAIANQGSSAQDEAFVNAVGEKGTMQQHFAVYHRVGHPCPRCHTAILGFRLAGRGTFFCPVCQPQSITSKKTRSPLQTH